MANGQLAVVIQLSLLEASRPAVSHPWLRLRAHRGCGESLCKGGATDGDAWLEMKYLQIHSLHWLLVSTPLKSICQSTNHTQPAHILGKTINVYTIHSGGSNWENTYNRHSPLMGVGLSILNHYFLSIRKMSRQHS